MVAPTARAAVPLALRVPLVPRVRLVPGALHKVPARLAANPVASGTASPTPGKAARVGNTTTGQRVGNTPNTVTVTVTAWAPWPVPAPPWAPKRPVWPSRPVPLSANTAPPAAPRRRPPCSRCARRWPPWATAGPPTKRVLHRPPHRWPAPLVPAPPPLAPPPLAPTRPWPVHLPLPLPLQAPTWPVCLAWLPIDGRAQVPALVPGGRFGAVGVRGVAGHPGRTTRSEDGLVTTRSEQNPRRGGGLLAAQRRQLWLGHGGQHRPQRPQYL